jgi:hypothetical protein
MPERVGRIQGRNRETPLLGVDKFSRHKALYPTEGYAILPAKLRGGLNEPNVERRIFGMFIFFWILWLLWVLLYSTWYPF